MKFKNIVSKVISTKKIVNRFKFKSKTVAKVNTSSRHETP